MHTEVGVNRNRRQAASTVGARAPRDRVVQAQAEAIRLPSWLTVEVALYGLVLALAAGLRLWALGGAVLSADEAPRALAAWHVVRGEPTDLVHGPALVYGSAAIFFLFTASDTSARLLPALLGLAIVAWPYFVREQIGRLPALFTAALLATSPSLVHASRTVSGESVALGLLLLATLGWLAYERSRWRAHLALAGIASGLTLTAGPAAFALLVPLALAAAGVYLIARRRAAASVALPVDWRWAGAWAAAGIVAVATGLLSQPFGLQRGLIDAGATWVASLFAGGAEHGWTFYGVGLLAYEPAVLLPAVLGLVLCRRRVALTSFLLLWAGLALAVYSLAAGRQSGTLAFVAFPLALAAGQAIAEVWERGKARLTASAAGLFLATTLPAVGLWGIVAGYLSLPESVLPPTFLLAPAILLAMAVICWAYWRGAVTTIYGLSCLAAVVLVGFALHTSTNLAFYNANNPVEMLVGRAPSPDLRYLVREVEDNTAVLATPGRRDIAVAVDEYVKYPLAWYLRSYTRVTYGAAQARPTAAIMGPDREPPPGEYRVQRYTLDTILSVAPTSPGQLWRWLVYRKLPDQPERSEVLLYFAAPRTY